MNDAMNVGQPDSVALELIGTVEPLKGSEQSIRKALVETNPVVPYPHFHPVRHLP